MEKPVPAGWKNNPMSEGTLLPPNGNTLAAEFSNMISMSEHAICPKTNSQAGKKGQTQACGLKKKKHA